VAQLLRLIENADIVCPAGRAVGAGRGVLCGVEQHVLELTEGTSIERYCTGDYKQCPSWRAEKEAYWEAQRTALEASDIEADEARKVPDGVKRLGPGSRALPRRKW
jgi:hypothetical protein